MIINIKIVPTDLKDIEKYGRRTNEVIGFGEVANGMLCWTGKYEEMVGKKYLYFTNHLSFLRSTTTPWLSI